MFFYLFHWSTFYHSLVNVLSFIGDGIVNYRLGKSFTQTRSLLGVLLFIQISFIQVAQSDQSDDNRLTYDIVSNYCQLFIWFRYTNLE